MSATLLIAAIILSAVVIFIILFILMHKKWHNKKLARQKVVFADVVWKNKLGISEHETVNNYLLAIDKINFVLLYINFSEPKEKVVLINLWNIKEVKVGTEDNSIYYQRKVKPILIEKQVAKLQLEITFLNSEPEASLVLYGYKDGMHNLEHIKTRADYWCKLINKSIEELPHSLTQNSKYA